MNNGKIVQITITPNDINLIQMTKTWGKTVKKIEKKDIEKFEIILNVKNLNYNYFINNSKINLPEIAPYCNLKIHIKTKNETIEYKVPYSEYSPKDYSLIFKFLEIKKEIPNFSYIVNSELDFIKKEIDYFSKNNKRLPFIIKQIYIFNDLPLICKLFFIFIFLGLLICFFAFCILQLCNQ